MNAQEREKLDQFLNQLREVKLTQKDKEAEDLIREAIEQQPDAAYLLIQRCLIQDQALNTAQTQIADLQQRLKQQDATPSGGFLDDNPWAPKAKNNDGVPGASNYQVPNTQSTPGNPSFAMASPTQAPAGAGFLGNIATTAAGVVAGSFLYQGIGSLLGHHASPYSTDQQHDSAHPAEQTVINNYYGDSDQYADHGMDENYMTVNDGDGDGLLDESDFDSDWI
ncbi:MAG: DUF2076 domain-containing protein [Gammaproteobacteria bacterium]